MLNAVVIDRDQQHGQLAESRKTDFHQKKSGIGFKKQKQKQNEKKRKKKKRENRTSKHVDT